jgi:hypothetical protein
LRSQEAELVLQILQTHVACQLQELNNRIQALKFSPTIVDPAIRELDKEGKVRVAVVTTPSQEKTKTKFINSTDFPASQIEAVIQEKSQILAKHYDLHEQIGKHGEDLVAQACESLSYTEIETRKTSHATRNLLEPGIEHRDIDVFARHPTSEYYQNIQVKNQRARAETKDVNDFIRISSIARLRWNIDIRTAVVAVRTQLKAANILLAQHIPIAYADNVYAPEEHRDLYEELNARLAYGFVITDSVSRDSRLYKNIAKYVLGHRYKQEI